MIEIVEVSPRDGLQNERTILSTSDKLELITRAIDAGARRLEVASFVNPARVPQMADAEAVVAGLRTIAGVTYVGLVLNRRGAERALAAGLSELGAVCVASDPFGVANQGQDSETSVKMASEVVALARAQGRTAQATIAVAFGCPMAGSVHPDRVIAIARELAAAGPREIALADTIGVARPAEVTALVERVKAAIAPLPVRVHFHDTRGTGVANAIAAINAGARTVDAAIAGTGGCPFAPGAAGNVATEDVVYALGGQTDLDLDALVATGCWLNQRLGRTNTSALMRVAERSR